MSLSDEMIERAALEIAREQCDNVMESDRAQCVASRVCHCWGYAATAAKVYAPALEAARAEGMMIARGLVQRKIEMPDCDSAIYDNSCGAWECSKEIRGDDCLCADRLEQAEAIVAAIDARLSEMDRQTVDEGRGDEQAR